MILSKRLLAASLLTVLLGGCSGLQSSAPADQIYMLRAPAGPAPDVATTQPVALQASLQILRVEAHPGLASERIALLRPGRRLDFFAGGRWAAGLPDVLGAMIVESFRASGAFANVSADRNIGNDYALDLEVLRFEAEYTAEDAPPTVRLLFDCTLLNRRQRNVLASFRVAAAVPAQENRLGSVVAAFEQAAIQALLELRGGAVEAIAKLPPEVAPQPAPAGAPARPRTSTYP